MILVLLFLGLNEARADPLSLNQYLDQVLKNSPAVRSSELLIQGSKESSLEGSIQTLPDFIFQGTHDDRNQNNISLPSGVNNELTLGVQETFGFGVNTKLTYDLLDSKNLLQGTIYGGSNELRYKIKALGISRQMFRSGEIFWAQKLKPLKQCLKQAPFMITTAKNSI